MIHNEIINNSGTLISQIIVSKIRKYTIRTHEQISMTFRDIFRSSDYLRECCLALLQYQIRLEKGWQILSFHSVFLLD